MLSRYRTRISVFAVVLVAMVAGTARESAAQYFGRNQVQYERFDFQVLQTEHFDIHYYPEERDAVEVAGVMAERWYSRLSRLLNHRLRGRQVIIYYASHPHFEQTNAIGGAPGESTGGVTEVFKRRIVLPFAGPLKETDHVLGHELVHAFQFDMTGQGKTVSQDSYPVALRLPLWFIEGMAEYLSVGPNDPHTSMWIRDALANDRLPSIGQLYDPRYFPYRFGQAFWAYVAGRWGDDVVGRILNAAARTGSAEHAMQLVLRIPIDSLVTDWHESIKAAYDPFAEGARPATEFGRQILGTDNSGRINTAPALSPSGEDIVFLSEKDLFSIEMFRADVATGEIEEKIVKTALDGHFESLQFINSAGTWDATGERFAFGAIANGTPVLTLIDAQTGKKMREVKVPSVGEIFNPTWSPDGRYVAFSAIVGGLSDLYIYDLETDNLTRATNDKYADLQPAWSPDGTRIAFVTDRFSTNLGNLRFGNYRLAMLDPRTMEVTPVPSFAGAKNINPQWTPDSRSLYFLSDQNGITNVYRLELASQSVHRITDLYSGVTGITGLSPALSAANDADKIAFSVYEDGEYNVYVAEDPAVLRGEPLTVELAADMGGFAVRDSTGAGTPSFNAGVLPPNNRDRGDIEAYLDDPDYGLADQNSFGTEDYRPKLSLDFVSRPYLTAGTDRFGTFVGGGASAYWSDMLGRHNLATQLQIQGSLKDVAAVVGYTNRRSRWNWGVIVGQVPYIRGGFAVGQAIVDGAPALIEQRTLLKQYNRELTGLVSYPFSRHSRFEVTAGVRNISFSSEQRTIVTRFDGVEIVDEEVDLPSPDALNLAQASIAYVYDNSFFGATAPILGQRARLEISPSLGSLNYFSGLADFRKYIMPIRPFTIAARVQHFGRYGSGAEDPILSDLFLGYPSQVRGYDFNSFSGVECGEGLGCPAFDRLFGSRIVVANAELRFPLFGALGIGQGMFGILPVDFIAFGDAGIAWDSDNSQVGLLGIGCESGPTCRQPVYSAGIGLRFNLLGFLIAEIDYVRPYQRPIKGAHWQFHFSPGF
jgi:Tol biopolymer transport system component